jgi:two-component system CheB/CheR fusion protein
LWVTILMYANSLNWCSRLEGHQVATAPDGIKALELSARGALQPDLILADYNLPNGMSGIEIIGRPREQLRRQIPDHADG